MVIWPAFRMRQYRFNYHPYHVPQFISSSSTRKSLNYGETLLVRNLDNDFENVENWLAIAMDKGTVEIPDWRSQLDSGQFTVIIM